MQLNRIFVPKPIKQKEVIWGYIPFIKKPFTKRELIFFALGIPLAIPFYFVYKFIFPPSDIAGYITMYMTMLFVPIIITLLSHKKINGNYIEKAIFQKIKYQSGSSVKINEKSLKTLQNGRNK
jgi:hypothetical protein